VAVDAQREAGVGVSELVHHRAGIDAESDGQRGERMPQLVRRQAPGSGTSPARSSRWSARSTAFVKTRLWMFGTSSGRPDSVANTGSSGTGERTKAVYSVGEDRPARARIPVRVGFDVEFAGGGEQCLDLFGAIEPHRCRSRDAQPAAASDCGVLLDVAVLDGDLEDLREPRDRLIDGDGGDLSLTQLLLATHDA
jgi:hypothetical protein